MLSWPMASAARRLPSASRLPRPSREPISSIARSSASPLAERQPRLVEPAALDAFHRERDGSAGADRVDAKLVAALRRAQHASAIAHAAQRAEREQALVLDAARPCRSRRCARSRSCTRRSSSRVFARVALISSGRDSRRLLERAALEVARRQGAEAIERQQIGGGAELAVLRRRRSERPLRQVPAHRRQLARMRPLARCVPRTAIALMFLPPSTAPLPPRPAWRPSWEMVA